MASSLSDWVAFSARLESAAMAIFGNFDVKVTERKFADPKILALALLCRTLSNMKGMVALAQAGLVVEARMLARACYENMFCVAGLVEKGDEFADAMYGDEIKSMISRGKFVMENIAPLEGHGAEFTDRLKKRLADMKDRWPKAKLLNPKETASQSVAGAGYLNYSQLSADAAHPSITALKRHLFTAQENGETVVGLDVQPPERGTELWDTLDIGCNAVVGVLVAVNQLLEVDQAREPVKAVFEEYGMLSTVIKSSTESA